MFFLHFENISFSGFRCFLEKSALSLIVAHLNLISLFTPLPAALRLFLSLIWFVCFLAVFIAMSSYDILYLNRTCLGFGIMLLESMVVCASIIQNMWSRIYYQCFYSWFSAMSFLSRHMPGYFYCMTNIYEILYTLFEA